jgi:hypothetical protein
MVAAAIFSLIAMWSMPGFPAVGPADQGRDSAVQRVPLLSPTGVSCPDIVLVPPPLTGSTPEGQVVAVFAPKASRVRAE